MIARDLWSGFGQREQSNSSANDQAILAESQAAELLDAAELPVDSSGGYPINRSDVEAWEIPGVVSFVSVAVKAPEVEVRSFVGAYFDSAGNQISTVEVVYEESGSMRSWTNGELVDPVAGGVPTLFTGPVGAAIAAAGGLKAALGGM